MAPTGGCWDWLPSLPWKPPLQFHCQRKRIMLLQHFSALKLTKVHQHLPAENPTCVWKQEREQLKHWGSLFQDLVPIARVSLGDLCALQHLFPQLQLHRSNVLLCQADPWQPALLAEQERMEAQPYAGGVGGTAIARSSSSTVQTDNITFVYWTIKLIHQRSSRPALSFGTKLE